MAAYFEYREDGTPQIREELNNFLEKADTRLISHIYYKILNVYKRIVVKSNGTDVFVLIFNYMSFNYISVCF